MSNINKVTPGHGSNGKRGDSTIDPEKFLQSLHVESAEEADQQDQKRQAIRQEELEQEYEEARVSIPVSKGLFKKYMTHPERRASLFDAKGGTKAHLVPESDREVIESDIIKLHVDPHIKSNIAVETKNASAPPQEEKEEETISDTEMEEKVIEDVMRPQTRDDKKAENKQSPHEIESKKKPKETIKTKEDGGPPKEETKTEKKEIKKEITAPKEIKTEHKKTPAPHIHTKDTPPKEEEKKTEKQTTKEERLKDLEKGAEKEGALFAKAPQKKSKVQTSKKEGEEEEEDLVSSTEKRSVKQEEDGNSSSKDQRDQNEEQDRHTVFGSTNATNINTPQHVSPASMSPFSNIPSDVFELFSKLIGIISLKLDSGKTTTTITLNMPDSVFNKCEVVLDHYDTAAGAFNIQFLGNPAAVQKFSKNMKNLNKAFQKGKQKFSVNLLSPKLSKEFSS